MTGGVPKAEANVMPAKAKPAIPNLLNVTDRHSPITSYKRQMNRQDGPIIWNHAYLPVFGLIRGGRRVDRRKGYNASVGNI